MGTQLKLKGELGNNKEMWVENSLNGFSSGLRVLSDSQDNVQGAIEISHVIEDSEENPLTNELGFSARKVIFNPESLEFDVFYQEVVGQGESFDLRDSDLFNSGIELKYER